jgi:hypothetical protein
MEIKDLNKPQMILLTLLICFVVSIATGIVTVSLMQKMPTTVPQTINKIIERTIQNVSTPVADTNKTDTKNTDGISTTDGNALVNVYVDFVRSGIDANTAPVNEPTPLGQGVIISEIGLIMVDAGILNGLDTYTVKLNNIYFQAQVLKKFDNRSTILKIIPKGQETKQDKNQTQNTTVDVKQ